MTKVEVDAGTMLAVLNSRMLWREAARTKTREALELAEENDRRARFLLVDADRVPGQG